MADPRHGFRAFEPYEGEHDVDEPTFRRVLADVVGAARAEAVDHVLIGGIASTAQGRNRLTKDVDVFVRPEQAGTLLDALAERGYETQRTDRNWIYKAFCDGVIVDIIFKAEGAVFLDDEMLERARTVCFRGVDIAVAPAEDLIVMKAITNDEDSPRHWHDALGLLAAADIDWEYFVRRSRKGVRRVLSMLLYAQSDDLPIPGDVVPELFHLLYPAGPSTVIAATPAAARAQRRQHDEARHALRARSDEPGGGLRFIGGAASTPD